MVASISINLRSSDKLFTSGENYSTCTVSVENPKLEQNGVAQFSTED